MYRYRVFVEIRYGSFREFLEISEEMNSLSNARGWTQHTHWVATVGKGNELIIESEFPTLDAFEKESRAKSSDPDWMKLLRRSAEFVVQGSNRDELLEAAPRLA
jgi:hypothetical protein